MLGELNTALAYPDSNWAFRYVTREMLETMDRELVARSHPLAFEPGTQERRFKALAAAKFQF